MITKGRIASLAVVAGIALGLIAMGSPNIKPVPYRLSGDYVEGCACRLICACDFGEDATSAKGCQATMLWHVDQGQYGDVSLDGLNVAAMLLKPVGNVGSSIGKMEGGLYVDEKATPEQRAALESWFRQRFGGLFGTLDGPRYVPIRFTKASPDAESLGTSYAVEIPGVLTLKNDPLKDEGGGRAHVGNSPQAFVKRQYVARSVVHTYDEAEWQTKWDFAGRNSFYGRFDYTP